MSFDKLNEDCIKEVLLHVSPTDLSSFARCCKRFAGVTSSMWKIISEKKWGTLPDWKEKFLNIYYVPVGTWADYFFYRSTFDRIYSFVLKHAKSSALLSSSVLKEQTRSALLFDILRDFFAREFSTISCEESELQDFVYQLCRYLRTFTSKGELPDLAALASDFFTYFCYDAKVFITQKFPTFPIDSILEEYFPTMVPLVLKIFPSRLDQTKAYEMYCNLFASFSSSENLTKATMNYAVEIYKKNAFLEPSSPQNDFTLDALALALGNLGVLFTSPNRPILLEGFKTIYPIMLEIMTEQRHEFMVADIAWCLGKFVDVFEESEEVSTKVVQKLVECLNFKSGAIRRCAANALVPWMRTSSPAVNSKRTIRYCKAVPFSMVKVAFQKIVELLPNCTEDLSSLCDLITLGINSLNMDDPESKSITENLLKQLSNIFLLQNLGLQSSHIAPVMDALIVTGDFCGSFGTSITTIFHKVMSLLTSPVIWQHECLSSCLDLLSATMSLASQHLITSTFMGRYLCSAVSTQNVAIKVPALELFYTTLFLFPSIVGCFTDVYLPLFCQMLVDFSSEKVVIDLIIFNMASIARYNPILYSPSEVDILGKLYVENRDAYQHLSIVLAFLYQAFPQAYSLTKDDILSTMESLKSTNITYEGMKKTAALGLCAHALIVEDLCKDADLVAKLASFEATFTKLSNDYVPYSVGLIQKHKTLNNGDNCCSDDALPPIILSKLANPPTNTEEPQSAKN